MFGAIYDLRDYRSTFGTATADFLAGNIVSNDLAAASEEPRVHIDRAAERTVEALGEPTGVVVIID